MELVIILGLILLNGFFSMSELALVSARRVRLENSAKRGNGSAKKALKLISEPDKFLSTNQIAITLIGILIGMYSGDSFRLQLAHFFEGLSVNTSSAFLLSTIVILIASTYLTIVLGELVPKRIGLSQPEVIARVAAWPISILSTIMAPFVWLLSVSSSFVLKLLNVKPQKERITEEEIRAVVQEGMEGGEVQEVEQDIVDRVFYLGDRKVASLITHRNDLVWIDISDSAQVIKAKLMKSMHRVYPVADKTLDDAKGIVFIKELFGRIDDPAFRLEDYIRPANYMFESRTVYSALEKFKRSKIHYSLVTDEFGVVKGLLTLNDILEALVGGSRELYADSVHANSVEQDGSVLFDGQYSFYDFLSYFDEQFLYTEHPYNTISGMLLDQLKHIPAKGEKLRWKNFEFTIVEMAGVRIHQVKALKVKEISH